MRKTEILAEINRRMEYHPGDAPWSCVKCYHNQPCVDREILILASKQLKSEMKAKEK